MLRILHGTNYDFIRWWRWAVGLTLAFIVLGISTIFITGGFKSTGGVGVFVGGSNEEQ